VDTKNILLVEDDPDCRTIYSRLLRHFGYGVLEAGNGEEAVRCARKHLPYLILMDLRLPVLDGWTAAARLKADPQTAPIPIIAFTAQVILGDDARARKAGFVRYFAKPVEPRDVLREIQYRIGPADPPHAA
jgi:two-component system cell cycle response regulator DivK